MVKKVLLLGILLVKLSAQEIEAETRLESLKLNSMSFKPRLNLAYSPYDGYEKHWMNFIEIPKENRLFFKTGNEVGDPLFQELVNEGPFDNYTPMIQGGLISKWGGVEFDQPDHFSIKGAAYRLSKLRNKNNAKDLAWFGENIPHYSMIKWGAQYDMNSLDINAKLNTGYLWTVDPITQSQELVNQKRYKLEIASAKHTISAIINQNKSLDENIIVTKDELELRLKYEYLYAAIGGQGVVQVSPIWADGETFVDLAFDYKYSHSYDDVWLTYFSNQNEHFSKIYFDHEGRSFENRLLGGFEAKLGNGSELSAEYSGPKKSLFYNNDYDSYELKPFMGVAGSPIAKFKYRIELGPKFKKNIVYFKASSYENIKGYFERKGEFVNNKDWFSGAVINGKMSTNFRHFLYLKYEGEYELREEHWDEVSDYIKPKWNQFLGVDLVIPTNLKILFGLNWRDGYELKNFGPEVFISESRLVASMAIEQYFLKRKLKFSANFLDIFANEQLEHPNSSYDRFRVIVSMDYLF